MSEHAIEAAGADDARAGDGRGAATTGKGGRNVFARIALFVRQVLAELKKVVVPTRPQLLNYTIVVLVFVAVVMAFVTLLDLGIGKAVFWIFGG